MIARVDWSATRADPHGYKKRWSAVDSCALPLDDPGSAAPPHSERLVAMRLVDRGVTGWWAA
jgi:hypothetical protein